MKKTSFILPVILLAGAFLGQAQSAAPTKVGIIHVQLAILNTKEGKKAAEEMNSKFAPKKGELEKKQNEIEGLEDRIRKGSATMSEDAMAKLRRDIDDGKKKLQRDSEDAQADWDQEENKVFNELGSKLYAIVEKYAKDNNFAIILDVSQQQPVLWASDSINITNDIISLYDKANPGTSAAPSATSAPPTKPPAAAPATRPPTAPGPAPAAPKKQ